MGTTGSQIEQHKRLVVSPEVDEELIFRRQTLPFGGCSTGEPQYRATAATPNPRIKTIWAMYPFAILFRELPVDRHEELIRRAMRWPDPLADQIVRSTETIKEFINLGEIQRLHCLSGRHE
jgi:hypothetical protein